MAMMSQIRNHSNPIDPPGISSDGNDSYPEAMLELSQSARPVQPELFSLRSAFFFSEVQREIQTLLLVLWREPGHEFADPLNMHFTSESPFQKKLKPRSALSANPSPLLSPDPAPFLPTPEAGGADLP